MQGPILQAVKLAPSSLAGRVARRIGRLVMLWRAAGDEVTYSIVERSGELQAKAERRTGRRRRTRLHSGKLLDLGNRFMVECQIHERSREGARLVLAKEIDIPDRVGLYDDGEMSIKRAEVIWRGTREFGIRFTPQYDEEIDAHLLAALSRQFYAVGS